MRCIRVAAAGVVVAALAAAGCSTNGVEGGDGTLAAEASANYEGDPPDQAAGPPDAPANDEAPTIPFGEGYELTDVTSDGLTVRGTLTVRSYEWHDDPIESYGLTEQGPFLLLDIEWSTKHVFFFDQYWLEFDDGGETQYPTTIDGDVWEHVPADGGGGYVVWQAREHTGGTVWLQNEHGYNIVGWKVDD